MKKMWSVILAVLLLLTSATLSQATDVTQPKIVVSKTNNSVLVTVEVPENVSGSMTAMILNDGATDDNVTLYGIGLDSEGTEIRNADSGELEGYRYEFSFTMHADAPTGKYQVFVGNSIERIGSEVFQHARVADIVDFCTGLISKDKDEIYAYIYPDNAGGDGVLVHPKCPVDVTVYKELTGNVLTMVNAKVDGLDSAINNVLNNVSGEYATVEAKAAKLDEIFVVPFEKWMDIVKIATVEDAAEWNTLATGLLGASDVADKFDNYFYEEATAGDAKLDVADVFEQFKTECASIQVLEFLEYQKAFDRATLMLIENTSSSGVLGNAFEYFAQKGIITPGANTQALLGGDYDSQLWQDLKALDNASCTALVSNAENLVTTNDYSISTGNGNQGTSSPSVNKPTNPGGAVGGLGGGSSFGGGSGAGGGTGGSTTTPVTPVVPEGAFSDIDNVEWAKEAIEALAELGILSGKGDGKFYPNDSVTREEFVKIIVAAFDLLDETAECDFNDVDKDSWSYPYIASANKLGIVTGDGENFNPKSGISRQDMAVIIYRVFEHLGLEVSGDAVTFDDGDDIADYAKDAVDTLTAAGIINGMGDGTFAPTEGVTRAQAAKVVYGLLQLVGGGK